MSVKRELIGFFKQLTAHPHYMMIWRLSVQFVSDN